MAVSQAKKRGAILLAGMLLVAVAIAIFVTAAAWVFVPGLAIALPIHLASPVDDDPDVPNNPLKLWLFVAGAGCGVALVILGLMSTTGYAIAGAVLLGISLPCIWVIRQRRNPWWLRGWLDYRGR